MPLQDYMQLISVDDHIIEHPRVWTDRLPKAMQEDGPRIVDGPARANGELSQVWQYQGKTYPAIGLNAVAGKDPKDFGTEPTRYDDMLPGCYDPVKRLADMDTDGVWASLNFPTFPRFAGTMFLEGPDRKLALACVQAYNDFVIDEWCAAAPDRYIPLTHIPLWDVDAAVAEIHRTAAKGAKSIAFPENPSPLGLPSFHAKGHWDPVFSACEEYGLPLSMHFGTSGQSPHPAPDTPLAARLALFSCNSMYCLSDILFSPVFHNHPKLKIALGESGLGWIPFMLERMDWVWERHRFYQDINQDLRPSEIYYNNVYACYISDAHGLDSREIVGVNNILWECDYPHSDSNFPNSRKIAEEQLRDVPDAEAHRIVELNARELFNFPK